MGLFSWQHRLSALAPISEEEEQATEKSQPRKAPASGPQPCSPCLVKPASVLGWLIATVLVGAVGGALASPACSNVPPDQTCQGDVHYPLYGIAVSLGLFVFIPLLVRLGSQCAQRQGDSNSNNDSGSSPLLSRR